MQPLLGKGAERDRASQTPKLLPSKGYLCSLLRVHFEHPWSQACGGRSGKVPASLVGSSPDPPAHYPTKWAGERNDDIQWGHRHSGLGVLGHHGKTWPWIFWTPAFFFFFLLCPWHVDVSRPGIGPAPQQRPELLQRHHQILNPCATRELLDTGILPQLCHPPPVHLPLSHPTPRSPFHPL